MTAVPDTLPVSCRRAGWGDFGRLLRISLSVQVLAMWKSLPLRVLMICMLGFITVMLLLLALLDWRIALGLSALFVGLMAVVTVLMTAYRLLDHRRLVLLTMDGTAGLDVVFRRRRSLSLRNHGRAFRSTAAHAMREAVKEWVRPLIGADFTISAQNQRVARLYMEQFPELQIIGRDWMGHPKLAVRAALPEFSGPSLHGG